MCSSDLIESVLVAEVIPSWVVGIVACAHSVDVELLHDLDEIGRASCRERV